MGNLASKRKGISGWTAYTPVLAGTGIGSFTENFATWRRVGASIEVAGTLQKDGSDGTGSDGLFVTLPSGLTIDAASLPNGDNSSNSNSYGSALFIYGPSGAGLIGATEPAAMSVKGASLSTRVLFYVGNANAYLTAGNLKAGSRISYRFTLPIAEWV